MAEVNGFAFSVECMLTFGCLKGEDSSAYVLLYKSKPLV